MLYDFECKKCGFKWDDIITVEKMNDPSPCPECGEMDNHKVFSANFNIRIFNGTRENNINYKIDHAIGKAKEERMQHQEKHGKYSEYVDTTAPIHERSVVDPDEVTYMGNVGKNDHQIFDKVD